MKERIEAAIGIVAIAIATIFISIGLLLSGKKLNQFNQKDTHENNKLLGATSSKTKTMGQPNCRCSYISNRDSMDA